ncbi:hypothetical protein BSL78_09696 [Apostichopus japonicus]|uniref:Death domain-containing protein n=1 Tax=Stichopus japonicus TaxID=307972 RepID=A0A2G8KZG2_STIJA|nr:hypothetical protein BSL78_09696 [Apostichopus japonicus]
MVNGLEKCLDHGAVTELAQLTEQDPDFVLKVDDLRRPFHHLMANWEKEGIVKEDDVDTLVELLDVLEAYEALDLVMEYKASFGGELTENSVSSKPQDIKPSVKCSSPREAATNIPSQEQEQQRTSSADHGRHFRILKGTTIEARNQLTQKNRCYPFFNRLVLI